MKKILKWVGVIFIVIIVIGVVAGKDDKEDATTNSNSQPPEAASAAPAIVADKVDENKPSPSISLTENEIAAVKAIIKDDIRVSFDDGDSFYDYGYTPVTAKEMFKVYSANEARGDKTFKGKKIIISGVVDSISSSIGDIPVVSLKTGEMFQTVNVNFARKYRDTAIDLNKNQKVSFACVGGTVVMGMPSVRDCVPLNVAINEVAEDKMKDVESALRNHKTTADKGLLQMVVFAKAAGKATDNFKSCKPDDINCISGKAKSIPKAKGGFDALMKESAKEMDITLPPKGEK
ncbi:OB-fold protein [Morganella morganii]|uniref:OB-fold protein n=1 Tax=Morganella morganii TaxID=582 RepID=UPI00339C8FF8